MTSDEVRLMMKAAGVHDWCAAAADVAARELDKAVNENSLKQRRFHYDVLPDGSVIAMFPWTQEDWNGGSYAKT